MDTFFDEAGPVEAIPRTDASNPGGPFRLGHDLVNFGASPTAREPSPSPTEPYRPPTDIRSPTPTLSPDRNGAVRSAHRDAASEYDRAAAAAEQLGQRSVATGRGDADGDADGHLYYSLDDNDRRELAFYREAARVQENVRRVERDRQSAGQSPQRIRAVAVPQRADVSTALEILHLDPKAVVTTGDRKDINTAGESAKPHREITANTSIEELFGDFRSIIEAFGGVPGMTAECRSSSSPPIRAGDEQPAASQARRPRNDGHAGNCRAPRGVEVGNPCQCRCE